MPIPEMWERSFTYLLMGVRSLSRHKIHPTLKCKGPKPLMLGMPLLPLLGILPHTCKGCNGWALYQWQRPYPWFRKWFGSSTSITKWMLKDELCWAALHGWEEPLSSIPKCNNATSSHLCTSWERDIYEAAPSSFSKTAYTFPHPVQIW